MTAKDQALALLTALHARGGSTRMLDGALCISPPELAEEFRPQIARYQDAFLALHEPIPSDQFEDTLLAHFGGFIATDHGDTPDALYQPDDTGWTPKARCEAALLMLARRDDQGRTNYTQSEIDAHIIGLNQSRHLPIVAEVIAKLREARPSALSPARLAERMRPSKRRYRHE